jgi:hypothetical protein
MLLEHGADVNCVQQGDGSLPIHEAVRENHLGQIELLIKYKTKLEVEDSSGRTPLDIAVDNDFVEAVKMLLEAGANPNRRNGVIETENKKIKLVVHDQVYRPTSAHDVCHVYWILARGLKRPLPENLARSIINSAEYFLKSEFKRSDYRLIFENDAGQTYLRSAPIIGHVRKVVFTIESRDQGWSSDRQFHRSYGYSWTWFVAQTNDEIGDENELERKIQVNVHASNQKRRHVVVYGRGKYMRKASRFEKLKGDTVAVLP